MNETQLTERGQVSVPAGLRKAMGLRPGQRLRWEQISAREIRVSLEDERPVGPLAVLGFARGLDPSRAPRPTAAWMAELRAGE
jgi:bifunctional DNA-binding transcriptional regulator/antitoxin component of YhaV-PrlF toxin-antitoxin module